MSSVCSIFLCPVCAVVSCVQTMVPLPVFGIFNVHTDVGAATVHGGCTDTVRQSALKIDPGRKDPLPHKGLEPGSVLQPGFSIRHSTS